jgi:spore germination protein
MRIHTVQPGDTLRAVAQRYGTSTRELVRLNELESQDLLVPGLHLLVSGGGSYLVSIYYVKSGDTITSIAKQKGLTVDTVRNWTGLTTSVTAPLKAGTEILLPKPIQSKKSIEINGYLLPQGTDSDSALLADVSQLTYVSHFSYQARADGSLQGIKDTVALAAEKKYRISPLLTVTNFDGTNFSTELAHTIMSNSSIRTKLIDTLGQTCVQKGYRGVTVDFEHMQPSDRPLYNQFISELGTSLHSKNLSISIAMGPKTGDTPNAAWMGAFDYATLGKLVDFLILMTYEWGWVGGPPLAGIMQHKSHS